MSFTIVSVYFFIPPLAIILPKINKNIFYLCFAIFTVYAFLYGIVTPFGQRLESEFFNIFKFKIDIFISYVLFGYIIKTSRFKYLSTKVLLMLLTINLLIIFYLVKSAHYVAYDFLPLCLAAWLLTVLTAKAQFKNNPNKFIVLLCKYSFAIYLVHAPLQEVFFSVLKLPMLSHVYLNSTIYFCLSMAASYLIIIFLCKSKFLAKYLFYMR